MAYYSGVAGDLAALRGAVVTACTADGWTLTGDILSKGNLFVRVLAVAPYLRFFGGTGIAGGALVEPTPFEVQIGTIGSQQTHPLQWPVEYEVHSFEQEVYLIVRYGTGEYQWAAWGRSTVDGLPGSGMWLAASLGPNVISGSGYPRAGPVTINPSGGGGVGNTGAATLGLFWADAFASSNGRRAANNYYLHHNLDGMGWELGSSYISRIGAAVAAPLVSVLPNSWNSESVLLPVRPAVIRTSGGTVSIVADLEHARWLRLDNYVPGDLVVLGHDRWKVYPFWRKNAAERDGGNLIAHTGTFGFAVRYQGP